ncbi:IPTL-CTERM sorting domain-containing protein [Paracidovorax sp. MALMAid1276]|uniref:IPTL-CTERM sorting domain-containing protein n=1 Tax=Paracidovorax sp. MALMAid1276 TaxID=3411631 RepID=UPI003B9BE8F0
MNPMCALRWRAWWLAAWLLLAVGGVHAQADRTWVSGVGDDANPCSRTAPCLTVAGALSKTASGGEISVLDPAALDGSTDVIAPSTLTITKPITIDGGGGTVAAFGGVSSSDSIVINLPTAGQVILRNVRLNGFGGVGKNGIRVASNARVVLDRVDVSGYAQNCLLVDAGASGASIDIAQSIFSNCATGIANRAAASVNVGHETSVVLNTLVGVSSNNAQGVMFFFNATQSNNTQNTNLTSYANGANASMTGGGVGCTFASQDFVPPSSVGNGVPGIGIAQGAAFQFKSTNCGAGAVVTITVTYDQAFPANTVLYKYGPATPGAAVSSWFSVPGATLSADRKSFSYSLTDNGVGDTNNALGFIDDPVVPVLVGTASIPTLSEWGKLLLAIAVLAMVWVELRRRGVPPLR